jgi:hypothetical protein
VASGQPIYFERGAELLHLVLTLDYEIFGNGSGDVMRNVIRPTDRLQRICDQHGAKLTIMFDVGEYWAFERHAEQLRQNLGYSPSEEMRRQAVGAIQRGHDVQLHLHPQWIGAEYDKGAWQLSNSQWRLADLPMGLGNESQITSIVGALYSGKQTLEAMIKPVKADYRCVCFRAGGFYAQPSRCIIAAMKKTGLIADSSVVKGHKTDVPFEVDYSHVETGKEAWWTTDTDITQEGKPGQNILEVCVSSRMEPYWRSLKMTKLRATVKRARIERASCSGRRVGRTIRSVGSPWMVMRRLFSRHASAFDFCKLSSKDMCNRIKESDRSAEQPVVLIGHSKDFFNDREFDRFLAEVKREDRVVFETVSQFIETSILSTSGRL